MHAICILHEFFGVKLIVKKYDFFYSKINLNFIYFTLLLKQICALKFQYSFLSET